jgi:hypothetical protein
MKIKTGFITNSSSTSFIIMVKDDLCIEEFIQLIGVEEDSDFYDLVNELYQNIQNKMIDINEAMQDKYWAKDCSNIEEFITSKYSRQVYEKYLEYKKEDRKIYVGNLSSDGEGILTSFFCGDYVEEETNTIYLNYTNC